jgi:hypothetical protein
MSLGKSILGKMSSVFALLMVLAVVGCPSLFVIPKDRYDKIWQQPVDGEWTGRIRETRLYSGVDGKEAGRAFVFEELSPYGTNLMLSPSTRPNRSMLLVNQKGSALSNIDRNYLDRVVKVTGGVSKGRFNVVRDGVEYRFEEDAYGYGTGWYVAKWMFVETIVDPTNFAATPRGDGCVGGSR